MAVAIRAVGTTPEIEVFDSGDTQPANDFNRDEVLASPAMFQIVLGVKYGPIATSDTIMYLKSLMSVGAHWAGFQIGPPGFR
jgi:uncharacterized protein (DUF849 family)